MEESQRRLDEVPSDFPNHKPISLHGNSLFGTVELVKLDINKHWPIPPHVTELFIEVGANVRRLSPCLVLPPLDDGTAPPRVRVFCHYSEATRSATRARRTAIRSMRISCHFVPGRLC